MLEVKVNGPGLKLQGQWKFKGETAIITKEEYKENAEYLEVLKGEVEKLQENTGIERNQENNKEDKELEALREKAKELGIRGAHSMKKENLIAKIEDAEKLSNQEDGAEGVEPQE